MTYQAVIGLEIHLQVESKTKLFSLASTQFGSPPNSQIAPLDMAFPGAMPSVNKRVVKAAIKMANSLNMDLSDVLTFDRKNYFYSDLAKGYQLTQYFNPLGRKGRIAISSSEEEKIIQVTRLHLEEDTAKQVHVDDKTLIDFNRAGMGLIEIVTAPDFTSGTEAAQFVKLIQKLALKLKVSSGKMQEGALRVDVNVSLKQKGSAQQGVIVEIKNLNSFRHIAKAVDAEVKRQKTLLKSGQKVYAETRRYHEINNVTVFMRRKEKKDDYRYFPDTNIAPIKISEDFITKTLSEDEKRGDPLVQYVLTEQQKEVLVRSPYLKALFIKLADEGLSVDLVANFLIGNLQATLKKEGVNKLQKIEDDIVALLHLYEADKISSKQLTIFYEQLVANKSLKDIYNSDDDGLIQSAEQLVILIDEVLLECEEAVTAYRRGKKKSLNYILGQIYRKSNNKVDPLMTKQLLLKKMEE